MRSTGNPAAHKPVKKYTYQFLVCFFSLGAEWSAVAQSSSSNGRLLHRSYCDAAADKEAGAYQGGLNAFLSHKNALYTCAKRQCRRGGLHVQNRAQRLQKSSGGDEGRDTVRVHVRRWPPVLVVPALLRMRGARDADAAEA